MNTVQSHWLGLSDYQDIWTQMKSLTDIRDSSHSDQIWMLEHPPVFTQGLAGKAEHVLNPGDIPVIQTDRGGQVTYHGPGQLVVYVLFDIRRMNIGIRQLVRTLEQTVIATLHDFGVSAQNRDDAPGVYVNAAKICSIGLRVRRGCSYHGIAFNIDMDLEPFARINPCGFRNLAVTQLKQFVPTIQMDQVKSTVLKHLIQNFGLTIQTENSSFVL